MTTVEEITNQGKLVYSLFWDSEGPGSGAEYERIYDYRGEYYPITSDEDEIIGYETLDQALEASELLTVTEATVEIVSKVIPTEELMKRLEYVGEEEVTIEINGTAFLATRDGNLVRKQ